MSGQLTHSQAAGSSSEPLLDATIGQAFDSTAARFPEVEALVVRHQGIRWTYREYQREVDRLACGLLALGIHSGDRVGIWAPNCYEWCLTQYATAKIGAIMVCINPAYRLYELEYALNKVQCTALITAAQFKTSDYLGMLAQLAPELGSSAPGELRSTKLPQLRTVIRMGAAKSPGMFNFDDVCALGGEAERARLGEIGARLSPSDAINIQFTSGTTGNPKGATLTHRNILNNGKCVGDGMGLTERDRLCIPVPLYHCFGMVMGSLACITHGSTAVFPAEAFEPGATLAAVAEERCTALHGVPTMFIAELEHPRFQDFDLRSLRTADTIDNGGWLHSGDIGVMDAEGYTQVTGRIKDMIIRGGENIYPREVEEFLYTHPSIQEVQVFGIPDARYGEQVCAWIRLREGATLSAEDLKLYCRDKITHFKIPHHIRFVEDFPMTVTGKMQKFLMREQMIDELAVGEKAPTVSAPEGAAQ